MYAHVLIYTWNPTVPCFGERGPCSGVFEPQNIGQKKIQVHIIYIYMYYILHIYPANPLPLCDQPFACVPPPSPVQPRGRCKAAKPTNHWTWWSMENRHVENWKFKLCFFLFPYFHWKEKRFQRRIFPKGGKPLEELGSTSNHST